MEKENVVMRRGSRYAFHNDMGKIRNEIIRDYLGVLQRHGTNRSTAEDKKTRWFVILETMAENKPVEYVRLFSTLIKQDALLDTETTKDRQRKLERTVKFVG